MEYQLERHAVGGYNGSLGSAVVGHLLIAKHKGAPYEVSGYDMRKDDFVLRDPHTLDTSMPDPKPDTSELVIAESMAEASTGALAVHLALPAAQYAMYGEDYDGEVVFAHDGVMGHTNQVLYGPDGRPLRSDAKRIVAVHAVMSEFGSIFLDTSRADPDVVALAETILNDYGLYVIKTEQEDHDTLMASMQGEFALLLLENLHILRLLDSEGVLADQPDLLELYEALERRMERWGPHVIESALMNPVLDRLHLTDEHIAWFLDMCKREQATGQRVVLQRNEIQMIDEYVGITNPAELADRVRENLEEHGMNFAIHEIRMDALELRGATASGFELISLLERFTRFTVRIDWSEDKYDEEDDYHHWDEEYEDDGHYGEYV